MIKQLHKFNFQSILWSALSVGTSAPMLGESVSQGSERSFEIPHSSTWSYHGAAELTAAALRYKDLIEAWRPQLGATNSEVCTSQNPAHSLLATGNLQQSLSPYFSYDLNLPVDIGMGRGVYPTALSFAYIVTTAAGDRVLEARQGQLQSMLPLKNYAGPFPSWPQQTSAQAQRDGERLIIASSPTNYRIYQKPSGMDVFLLTSVVEPGKSRLIRYGENGISEVSSTNSCDAAIRFAYANQRLAYVLVDSSTVDRKTLYSYDSSGAVAGIRSQELASGVVLDEGSSIAIQWQDQKLAKILAEDGSLIRAFTYSTNNQGRFQMTEIKTAEQSTSYAYADGKSAMLSSQAKLPTVNHFDACRLTFSETGGLSTAKSEYRVIATDIQNLELTQIISTTQLDGTKVENTYQDGHTNLLTNTKATDRNGVVRAELIFGYNEYAQVTSITTKQGGTGYQTLMAYDQGRMTSRTSPVENLTLSYNAEGFLIAKSNFEESVMYLYNDNGQVVSATDKLNQLTTDFQYNDRCLLEARLDATGSVVYTYDERGRVVSKKATGLAAAEHDFNYDELGNVTVTAKLPVSIDEFSQGHQTKQETYDAWGNLLLQKFNDKLHYDYEILDHLKIKEPVEAVNSYE